MAEKSRSHGSRVTIDTIKSLKKGILRRMGHVKD